MSFSSMAAAALGNHQQDQTLTTDHDKPIPAHSFQLPSKATTLTSSKVEVPTSKSAYAVIQTSVAQGPNVNMEASTLPMAGDDNLEPVGTHTRHSTLAKVRGRGEEIEPRGYLDFRSLNMTSRRISISRTSQSTCEGQPIFLPPIKLRDDFHWEGRQAESRQPEPETRAYPHQPQTSPQHTLLSLNIGSREDLRQPRQQRDLSIASMLNPSEARDRETSNRQRSCTTNESPILSNKRPLPRVSSSTASSFLQQQDPPNMASRPILYPRSPSARTMSTGMRGWASIAAQPPSFLPSSKQVHMVESGPNASSEILRIPTSGHHHHQQQQHTFPPASSQASPAPLLFQEGRKRLTSSYHSGSPSEAVIQAGAMQFQGASRVPEAPHTSPDPRPQGSRFLDSAGNSRQTSTTDLTSVLTMTTSRGSYDVPVDSNQGSKLADKRRAGNTAAVARFRQRKRENSTIIENLQQRARDLERRARDAEQDRDRYKHEINRLRDLVLRNPETMHLAGRGPLSP